MVELLDLLKGIGAWIASANGLATVISVLSLTISVVTVYLSLLAPARLSAVVSHVTLLRMAKGVRDHLFTEMILDALIDPEPGEAELVERLRGILSRETIESGDRRQLRSEYFERVLQGNVRFVYSPSPERAAPHFDAGVQGAQLHVPMIIANSGARTGHVDTLILRLVPNGERAAPLAFPSFHEVNLEPLLRRSPDASDVDRIGGFFLGTAVAKAQANRIDPVFSDAGFNDDPSEGGRGLAPGDYSISVIGFDRGNKVFESQPISYSVRAEQFLSALKGGDSIDYVRVEDAVATTLR